MEGRRHPGRGALMAKRRDYEEKSRRREGYQGIR